jgi:hypothetical protein
MKKNCLSEKILSAFFGGELDRQTEKKVFEHLVKCRDCAEKAVVKQDIKKILRKPTAPINNILAFEKQLTQRIGELLKQKKPPKISLTIVRDHKPIFKIGVIEQDLLCTFDMTEPGLYALIDQGGRILWKEELLSFEQQKSARLLIIIRSPSELKIDSWVTPLLPRESKEKGELVAIFGQKHKRIIPSIDPKKS